MSIGIPRNYYNTISIKNRYLGYFDNRKCYIYVPDAADKDASQAFAKSGYVTKRSSMYDTSKDNQEIFRDTDGGVINTTYKPMNLNAVEYFKVSSNAVDTADGIGLCSGNNSNEFSGNMLNWASMTAIDIFRQALTGGNRAATIQSNSKAYELGDTQNETYLRRAMVTPGRQNHNQFVRRFIYLPDNLLKRVMPHKYASDNISDFVSYNATSYDQYAVNRNAPDHWVRSKFGDGNAVIVVEDQGFTVNFRRRFQHNVCNSVRWGRCNSSSPVNRFLPVKSRYMPYHAVVRVCDDAGSAQTYGTNHPTTSIQCTQYPNNKYKPTGLMQERIADMRFGALGYANVPGRGIHGGVLRARMKSLLGETAIMTTAGDATHPIQSTGGRVDLGAEVNADTGQFIVNPDVSDASNSRVNNSGVINYLNKFGDYAGYKTNDPGAELYYVAQRYLRNAGFPKEYLSFKAEGQASTFTLNQIKNDDPTNLAREWKDNFPIILDWDNPLVVKDVNNVRENACRPVPTKSFSLVIPIHTMILICQVMATLQLIH